MDLSVWLAFLAAAWAISLSPGPGAVAAMSAGMQHGFRRGYWMTLGLVAGIWTQLLVVGLGLGVVIATSALAFTLVKWCGVIYLVWMGVQQWRAPVRDAAGSVSDETGRAALPPSPADGSPASAAPARRRDLVLRGWTINAINPKGTVFMLAVVPQFLQLDAPLLLQYLVVGLTLAFTDVVVMAGYTLLAARVLGALRSARHQRVLNRVFGGLFVLAGLLLATFKRSAP